MYTDYLERLHRYFEAEADRIEAVYGFEYGPEFEQALKETLRQALPERYGVDNGYVANPSGDTAGDDIIIYESLRYPTLRSSTDGQKKNRIPREAAYCYIEAKHSVYLEGDGDKGQSLAKALKQVADVKRLVGGREERSLNKIGKYEFEEPLLASTGEGFPEYQNPPYGAIFARYVRPKGDEPPLSDPTEINAQLEAMQRTDSIPLPQDERLYPDLLVLGSQLVSVPEYPQPNRDNLFRPFHVPGKTDLRNYIAEHGSFGTGFAAVMAALDWIELGKMPWGRMLVNDLTSP